MKIVVQLGLKSKHPRAIVENGKSESSLLQGTEAVQA